LVLDPGHVPQGRSLIPAQGRDSGQAEEEVGGDPAAVQVQYHALDSLTLFLSINTCITLESLEASSALEACRRLVVHIASMQRLIEPSSRNSFEPHQEIAGWKS
jgi:hypothetical protein